jgi:glucosamine--fructose-6-phosphate aminotransferase (isomerizing)
MKSESEVEQHRVELGATTRQEIRQEPDAIRHALDQDQNIKIIAQQIFDKNPCVIIITGSGTSSHAGAAGTFFLHIFAKVYSYCLEPSEFPYYIEDVLDSSSSVVLALSQSGESPETLQACEIAKDKGSFVAAITNTPGSSLNQMFPETTIFTDAGEERSVLATKTYSSQLAIVAALALELGLVSGKLDESEYKLKMRELEVVPDRIEVMTPLIQETAKSLGKYLKFLQKAFVLGTGPDVPTALEAALKLKEGARIVAQGYSAPEFSHGPLTLADRETLIIVLIPNMSDGINDTREKIIYRIIERVKEQGASVLAISTADENIPSPIDFRINLPKGPMEFNPLIAIVPIQYLVLEIAIQKGLNPDHPEFLTKVSRI